MDRRRYPQFEVLTINYSPVVDLTLDAAGPIAVANCRLLDADDNELDNHEVHATSAQTAEWGDEVFCRVLAVVAGLTPL